jgi:hypothetical protein
VGVKAMKATVLIFLGIIFCGNLDCSQKRGRIQVVKSSAEVLDGYRNSGRKIVTFVGYSGKGYKNPAKMLQIAIRHMSMLDPDKYIVNIGVTPQGIGKIYSHAKAMGFQTMGIVSHLVKPYLDDCKHVDSAFLVEDDTWGGYSKHGKGLNPTSKVIVESSDLIIGIGGGTIAKAELLTARKSGVKTYYYPVESRK